MKDKIVTVDVREDIRKGQEPFSKIMRAVQAIRDGEQLLLRAPFKPTPLFAVLASRGFAHEARQLESGDWEVLFTRANKVAEEAVPSPAPASAESEAWTEVVEVDARGLEPPQPMIKILETLTTLEDGAILRAHTERRPMHLYAALAERGFLGESEQQTDGSYITTIKRV
jgi:uncharacterized protein (DUF2249 family)